jgi:uncharacterized protein YbaP (TraB family)
MARSNNNRILKYLLTFILLFSLVFPFYGCTSPETTTTQDEGTGKSFIWKISSDESFVYLLGSIHVATKDTYPLDSSIENAFDMSDRLAVEININDISTLKVMLLIEKYGTYPQGEGLKENLPESLYTKLENQFSEMDMPASVMDIYRPWVIYIMMEGLVVGESDYSPEYGIDMYFLNRAIENDMEIAELETAESQIEMLSSIPDEMVIRAIEMSIEEPLTAADVDYMFELWEEGDAAGLETFLIEGYSEEPALESFYEIFITQRNYNMLAKIEEYLADEYVYFIAVGAAHLVGDEGLISLLEEAGYSVEQLEN